MGKTRPDILRSLLRNKVAHSHTLTAFTSSPEQSRVTGLRKSSHFHGLKPPTASLSLWVHRSENESFQDLSMVRGVDPVAFPSWEILLNKVLVEVPPKVRQGRGRPGLCRAGRDVPRFAGHFTAELPNPSPGPLQTVFLTNICQMHFGAEIRMCWLDSVIEWVLNGCEASLNLSLQASKVVSSL